MKKKDKSGDDDEYKKNNNSNECYEYPDENYFKTKKSEDDDCSSTKICRRTDILKKLMTIEYPAQRSKEWFAMREGAITASDAAQSINDNHYNPQFDFVCKKIFNVPFPDNPHCYNGKKYENIATMIYCLKYDVCVEEFGLILHPKYKFLAASPDGIVNKYKLDKKHKTKMVGRMVEIKCPTLRRLNHTGELKGVICPIQYWIQVQNQLECCDLDQCDFLQCKITEYEDRQSFIDDTDKKTPYKSISFKKEKGAIIQLVPKEKYHLVVKKRKVKDYHNEKSDGEEENEKEEIEFDEDAYNKLIWGSAKWIYPPKLTMTPLDYDIWISETIQNISTLYPDFCLDRVYYWRLEDMTCDTIEREKDWFAEHLDKYKNIWKYVEFFRDNKDKKNVLEKYLETFKFKNDGSMPDNTKKKKYNTKIMAAMKILLNKEDRISKNDYDDYVTKLIKKTKDIPDDKASHH